MKRRSSVFMLIGAMAVAVLLAGCAQKMNEEKTGSSAGVSIVNSIQEIDEWPDNVYTVEIPEPAHGTVYQSMTVGELYSVWLKDISRRQVKGYIELLKKEGYHEIGGDENEVSGGILLKRENVYVQVAYSGDGMGVGVSFDKAPDDT